MVRPLKYASNTLKEMTDAELDRLCYNLRLAYAAQLNSSGSGYIYEGSGNTAIGSLTDTISESQYYTRTRDFIPGDDYPGSYPPLFHNTSHGSFNYRQNTSVPSFPSNSTLDLYGYVYYSSNVIRTANTSSHLYDEILSQTITDMRTGDEVGTYRVQTGSPGSGWTEKDSAWFIDHNYSSGYRQAGNVNSHEETRYRLYLRTSATASGSVINPLGLNSNNLKERSIGSSDNLISSVLLPALTRRLSNGDLRYTVSSSNSGGINRGSFNDTRITASTTAQNFSNPTYFNYRNVNTGAAPVTVSTRYLILA